MNKLLKYLLLTGLTFSVFLLYGKENRNEDTKHSAAFRKTEFPGEISSRIPVSADFAVHLNGMLVPSILISDLIKKNLKDKFLLKDIPPDMLLNKYFIFGSTKENFCTMLIKSQNGISGNLFHLLNQQLKLISSDTVEIQSSRICTVSKEKNTLLTLYHKNLMLLSIGKTDSRAFENNPVHPILENIDAGLVLSAFFKGKLDHFSILEPYLKDFPEIQNIEETKISFRILTASLDMNLKFNNANSAESLLSKLDAVLSLTRVKFPDFPSTVYRKRKNNRLYLSVSIDFFHQIGKVVKFIKRAKQETESIANLKAIGFQCLAYDSKYNRFPESLDLLVENGQLSRKNLLLSFDKYFRAGKQKKEHISYAYLGNGFDSETAEPQLPLIIEKPWILPRKSRTIRVMLGDGRVISAAIKHVSRMSCRQVISVLLNRYGDKISPEHKEKLLRNAQLEDSGRL